MSVSSILMIVACIWYSSMDQKSYTNVENVHEHGVSLEFDVKGLTINESFYNTPKLIVGLRVERYWSCNFNLKPFCHSSIKQCKIPVIYFQSTKEGVFTKQQKRIRSWIVFSYLKIIWNSYWKLLCFSCNFILKPLASLLNNVKYL